MRERYSDMNELAAFGFLANTLGGGGDREQSFPQSDAEDMSRGARFIPGEVTIARRRGERVAFVANCSPCCWYWEFEDGSRIYHWDRFQYERIAEINGVHLETNDYGTKTGNCGPCPFCDNPHTSGGYVRAT